MVMWWVRSVLDLTVCAGLDPSSYRSSRPEDVEADGDVDGCGRALDPFEGTEGLHVACSKCATSTVLQGSQVGFQGNRMGVTLRNSSWGTSYETNLIFLLVELVFHESA